MTSIGWATLDVIPSFKGMARELDKGTSGPLRDAGAKGGLIFGDHAGKAAGARFGSLFKNAAKASLLGAAGLGAGAFSIGKDALSEASDLGESINALNVSYGKQAKGIKRLGREAADSLGLSNNAFNDLAVQFSGFSKTIAGGDSKKVVGILDDLSTRGADFASVMNLGVSDSLALFQSGLAGETEPLRKFGIDLSAAAVTAHAYKIGIAEAGDELTEQQKVQARYALLMKETAKTQGDFANTSDSLANRQRKLTARWDNAQASLGKGLLPIVEDFTGFLLTDGLPAVEKFGDWFTKDGIPAIKDFGGFVRDDLAPPLKDAAGFAGDLVGVLKDLPSPAKYAGLAALLGGGAALKLRGGRNGALGTVGSALGLAKPVPVFVTNAGAFPGGTDLPGGRTGGTKVPPILAGNSSLLNKFIKMGGPGGLIALSGMFADRGIVDEKGNPAKIASPEQTKALLESIKFIDMNLDAARAKAAGLGTELDLVGARKVMPRIKGDSIKAANDAFAKLIGYQIDAGRPVTPYINTTSIERAIAAAQTLNATLHGAAQVERGVDNGATFQHGGGASTNPRAGVQVNIGTVQAHDYDDFMQQAQRRAQSAGLGGRPY